jgi:hypothetical protein
MARTLTVSYVITLEADEEHTEEDKVTEIKQLAKDQAAAVRLSYDEGISVEGTVTPDGEAAEAV